MLNPLLPAFALLNSPPLVGVTQWATDLVTSLVNYLPWWY